MATHRVIQLCFASRSYWSEIFEGSRYQCEKHIRDLAQAGRHTCHCHITSRSLEDFRRLNPLG